jgi:hypothetical protein
MPDVKSVVYIFKKSRYVVFSPNLNSPEHTNGSSDDGFFLFSNITNPKMSKANIFPKDSQSLTSTNSLVFFSR